MGPTIFVCVDLSPSTNWLICRKSYFASCPIIELSFTITLAETLFIDINPFRRLVNASLLSGPYDATRALKKEILEID